MDGLTCSSTVLHRDGFCFLCAESFCVSDFSFMPAMIFRSALCCSASSDQSKRTFTASHASCEGEGGGEVADGDGDEQTYTEVEMHRDGDRGGGGKGGVLDFTCELPLDLGMRVLVFLVRYTWRECKC